MKAKSSRSASPLAANALKIVGVILVLSSLLDYIVLSIPFQPTNRAWLLNWTTQLVDRGIIPMVGLALLLAGYWISRQEGAPSSRTPVTDLRFWGLLVSSILGLTFLVLFPLHLNNINYASDQALKQIEARAQQFETQLTSEKDQLSALLKDDQKLGELQKAIGSGQVQGAQLDQLKALNDQLQQFRQDPNALNKRIEETQGRIRSERLAAEQRAKTEATKSVIRVGLSSLLLAIGYLTIGGLGLGSLLGKSRRKA